MTIIPIRNLLLVKIRPEAQSGSLIVLRETRPARPVDVVAVGPEVRDVKVGDVAVVNTIAGTVVGDQLLVPETAVLGTLPCATS